MISYGVMLCSSHIVPVNTTSSNDDDLEEALRISQQAFDDAQHGRNPRVDTEGIILYGETRPYWLPTKFYDLSNQIMFVHK